MAQALQQDYMDMPVITKAYTTACILTTAAVQLDLISPFQLYFNPVLIIKNYQIWRLFTTFLFFGPFGFNFFFNIIFTYRYCRMLEEGSFRGRTGDFFYMFLFGGTLMVIFAMFVNLLFLGQAFTIMLVYIWSRRNPYVRMNFFGLLNFQAPYLPWVLLAFSLLLGNSIVVDLMEKKILNFSPVGEYYREYSPKDYYREFYISMIMYSIAVGHIYYFLEDVVPSQPGGMRFLKTPRFISCLFESPTNDTSHNPLPEDRPGGFDWGGNR